MCRKAIRYCGNNSNLFKHIKKQKKELRAAKETKIEGGGKSPRQTPGSAATETEVTGRVILELQRIYREFIISGNNNHVGPSA